MSKKLEIIFTINNAQARAATKKQIDQFVEQQKGATKVGDAVDRATKRTIDATKRATKEQFVSLEKLQLAHTNFIDKVSKKKEAASAVDARRNKAAEQGQFVSLDRVRLAHTNFVDKLDKKKQIANAVDAKRRTAAEQGQFVSLDRVQLAHTNFIDKVAKKQASADAADAKRREAAEREQFVSLDRLQVAHWKFIEKVDKQKARAAAVDAKRRKKEIDDSWKVFEAKEKAAEKAADAQERASRRAKAAAQKHAESQGFLARMTENLASSITGMVASYAGMSGVRIIMEGLAKATHDAVDEQKRLSDEVERHRDAARELRSMEGKGSTTQEAIADAKFGAKTGMKPEEVLAFKSSFMGSGAQFEGKTMAKDEFAEFQQNTARLAVAKGIDPSVMGDLAGKTVGMKDYSKLGNKAGETALGDFNQMIAILQRGSGNNKQLVDQLSKLGSFSFNEDEVRGSFSSHKDIATALSTAAEISPDQSEVYVRNAMKAVRGFGENDKQARLLKKAGVTPQTKFFESFEKLAPVIEEEAKRRGLKMQDVIAENFSDEREQKAVGAFINKGVRGKVIKDRLDFGDKMAGPKPAFDEIEKFETDPDSAGPSRRGAAEAKAAEFEQGAETLRAENLYKFGEADLRKQGKLGTKNANRRDFFTNLLSKPAQFFGFRGPDSQRGEVMNQGMSRLAAKAKEKGEHFSPLEAFRKYGNDEAELSRHVNREIERLSKKGVDVYGEPTKPLATYDQQLKADQEWNDAHPLIQAVKGNNRKPPKAAPRPNAPGRPPGQPRRP